MADRATLAKARRELEEMYLGIPDDSVNLTFGDLADVKPEKRKSGPLEPIKELNPKKQEPATLTKLPSLDFSRAFLGASHHHVAAAEDFASHRGGGENHHHHNQHVDHHRGYNSSSPRRHAKETSMAYDDMSVFSTSPYRQGGGGGGGRRRPGIPHSNICTVCSMWKSILQAMCELGYGRDDRRKKVHRMFGEKIQRKVIILFCKASKHDISLVGLKVLLGFVRYIQRAGQTGCCMKFRYPSMVMQQELKWAEKGPRRSGERRYGSTTHSTMMSRSRSPITPRTPTRAHSHGGPAETPSFVMNSPYSAYSPTNHPLPF
ncbi:hypothetical protein TEA_025487 [Camellia sinensis var. sinensis]|uniref:Uncharacterized protein n=1 Tax=Camellia sinensis var. sinensis TaxID=542762 RepID=A0A4S4ET56_CAMSN|nr:hypothetical protein TEA_025487 [Camellia sinensis var. sinensis]